MKTFSIKDIPEFSQKERIVVVGIIGKSPYRYSNKTTPLLPNVQTDEVSIYFTQNIHLQFHGTEL